MNKRIGMLGGISYESTKQYYELIHNNGCEFKVPLRHCVGSFASRTG